LNPFFVSPGKKILLFDETTGFGERALVAARMPHVENGWVLEAADQKTGLLVGGERHGAVHALHAACLEPLFRLGDERARDIDVVDGVEIAEVTGVVFPRLEPSAIHGGGRAAHETAVFPRREQGDFGVLVERILLWIQAIADHHLQRRDP
jgi:hypothetical protein